MSEEKLDDAIINIAIFIAALSRLVVLPFKLLYRFSDAHHMVVIWTVLPSCAVAIIGFDRPNTISPMLMSAVFVLAAIGTTGLVLNLVKPSSAPELKYADHKTIPADQYNWWDN